MQRRTNKQMNNNNATITHKYTNIYPHSQRRWAPHIAGVHTQTLTHCVCVVEKLLDEQLYQLTSKLELSRSELGGHGFTIHLI